MTYMLKCNKCKLEKEYTDFNKSKTSKTGYQNHCKICKREHYLNNKKKYIIKSQEQYIKNKKNILEEYKQKYQHNPEYYKQKSKEYQITNIDKVKKYKKKKYESDKGKIKQYIHQWYTQNREYCLLKSKQWDIKNRERKNKRQKERYKNDINFKLMLNLRGRLNIALNNSIKQDKTIELLGCNIIEFKQHLESQFKPEMNWDNHGEIWEIDHIKPCSSFDLTDIEQQKQCFHYTNMQPLFKTTEIANSFGYNEIGNRNKQNKL